MSERRPTTQAVILARGLGTRMRSTSAATDLTAEQQRAADAGMKGMIRFARPFLDYVISGLADAGITDVVLVIGDEHTDIREYYTGTGKPKRVRIRFAVQSAPRGTADAVYAARVVLDDASFLVLNSDNYYPPEAYSALAAVGGAGLVAFEADALVRLSGISAERVFRFALVESDADGWLRFAKEKPSPDDPAIALGERWVSMNLWSFTPRIFEACERVKPSPRGELELVDAVMIAIRELGERFRMLRMHAGVPDLSSRADVAFVASHLEHVTPRT